MKPLWASTQSLITILHNKSIGEHKLEGHSLLCLIQIIVYVHYDILFLYTPCEG